MTQNNSSNNLLVPEVENDYGQPILPPSPCFLPPNARLFTTLCQSVYQ
jgi:hypothetical protein